MESRMRTTESTEGTRLRQSNWGEIIHIPCTVSKAFSVLSTSPLPPVPRKAHFTKQETDVER